MMSKGSKPRPLSVSQQKFEDNWNKIFGERNENNRLRARDGGVAEREIGDTKREQLPQDSNDNR